MLTFGVPPSCHSPVSLALDVLALALLLAALLPLRQLVTQLPAGVVRTRWRLLALLVFAMLLVHAWRLAHAPGAADMDGLRVSALLLMGAAFVCVACHLTWRAVQNIQRMPAPDRAQISEALSGLYDRKSLDGVMRRELQRADRHGVAVSVLLMDVDDFARINRSFGRAAGDEVLTEIGRILGASVRATDVLVRFSGEEIAIVAPHIGPAEALQVAERLRREVEAGARKALRQAQGASQAITVSIGVAGREAGVKGSADLVVMAQGALQKAKREGRNRIVLGAASAA